MSASLVQYLRVCECLLDTTSPSSALRAFIPAFLFLGGPSVSQGAEHHAGIWAYELQGGVLHHKIMPQAGSANPPPCQVLFPSTKAVKG